VRRQQAVQGHVEEGVEEGQRLEGARGQGPTECFQVISMSMGAISTWVICGDVDGAELAAAMPRSSMRAIMRGAAVDDFFLVEDGQFGEIARLGHDQLDDARGLGGAQALPPGHHHLAQQVGAVALEFGDRGPSASPMTGTMLLRTTALNSSSLFSKYR
jgi:hypothetical protein